MQQSLPLYTLRRSSRARRVRLTVTPSQGLVIVVPDSFQIEKLPDVLEEKREWIQKSLQWAQGQRPAVSKISGDLLPAEVHLRSQEETLKVVFKQTDSGSVTAREDGGIGLTVSGAVHNRAACRTALKRWLSRKARSQLNPLLKEASWDTGLFFSRVMIGNQRSRWASCSANRTISLNQKLLFLPRELVRYVMLHELCHTVHLNHSADFWNLVEGFEPDFQRLDRALRYAGDFVPAWAE